MISPNMVGSLVGVGPDGIYGCTSPIVVGSLVGDATATGSSGSGSGSGGGTCVNIVGSLVGVLAMSGTVGCEGSVGCEGCVGSVSAGGGALVLSSGTPEKTVGSLVGCPPPSRASRSNIVGSEVGLSSSRCIAGGDGRSPASRSLTSVGSDVGALNTPQDPCTSLNSVGSEVGALRVPSSSVRMVGSDVGTNATNLESCAYTNGAGTFARRFDLLLSDASSGIQAQ